jgi:hypothetical protein
MRLFLKLGCTRSLVEGNLSGRLQVIMRVNIIFALPVIFSILLIGCSTAGSGTIKASLGKEFALPVGQTASISGEDLQIKFEAVTADSRCSKGLECIRAGEAKCQVQLTSNREISEEIIEDTGGQTGYSQTTFFNYKASFRVEPYPEAGKRIASNDYRLLMTVRK